MRGTGKGEDKIYMLQSKGPVLVFKHLLLSVDVFISRTPETPVREKCKQRDVKTLMNYVII